MRLTIQRVKRAKVTVENEIVGQINHGVVVLLGFGVNDDNSQIKKAAQKVLKMRLWDTLKDPNQPDKKIKTWDSNLMQNNYGCLVVSQFTLYGYMNGNKPDFHKSLGHEKAEEYYKEFVEELKKGYKEDLIQTGSFRKMMDVELVNDGPVTLNLEY